MRVTSWVSPVFGILGAALHRHPQHQPSPPGLLSTVEYECTAAISLFDITVNIPEGSRNEIHIFHPPGYAGK